MPPGACRDDRTRNCAPPRQTHPGAAGCSPRHHRRWDPAKERRRLRSLSLAVWAAVPLQRTSTPPCVFSDSRSRPRRGGVRRDLNSPAHDRRRISQLAGSSWTGTTEVLAPAVPSTFGHAAGPIPRELVQRLPGVADRAHLALDPASGYHRHNGTIVHRAAGRGKRRSVRQQPVRSRVDGARQPARMTYGNAPHCRQSDERRRRP
jgi:hypothetical protein